MTNEQAAEILEYHNKWRRDQSDNPMPMKYKAKELGLAIDLAITALRNK